MGNIFIENHPGDSDLNNYDSEFSYLLDLQMNNASNSSLKNSLKESISVDKLAEQFNVDSLGIVSYKWSNSASKIEHNYFK